MNVLEYLEARDTNVHALSIKAGISYGSLRRHVLEGRGLSVASAKKLQACTAGAIRAVDVLGLEDQPRLPKPRRTGTEG
jgi:hypothetical protein